VFELDKCGLSLQPIWDCRKRRDAFHYLLRSLTAMRYLSKAERDRRVKHSRHEFQLSFSQALLRGLIVDEFQERNQGCDKENPLINRRLAAAVSHFIYHLRLVGPRDYKAFFNERNYEKVAQLLDTHSPILYYQEIKHCLNFYLHSSFVGTEDSLVEGIQRVFLPPQEILTSLLKGTEHSVPYHKKLTSAQLELHELAFKKFKEQFPDGYCFTRGVRSSIRSSIGYFILLLDLEGKDDLGAFSKPSNYDEVTRQLQTPPLPVSKRKSIEFAGTLNNYIRAAFLCCQKPAERLFSSGNLRLTPSQAILHQHALEYFRQKAKDIVDLPQKPFLHARSVLAYFIVALNLQGPEDLHHFSQRKSFETAIDALRAGRFELGPSTIRNFVSALKWIYKACSGGEPFEQTTKVILDQLDPQLNQLLKRFYPHRHTRSGRALSLRKLIEYSNIKEVTQLREKSPYERLLQGLQEDDNIKSTTIYNDFSNLATFLDRIIQGYISLGGVQIDRNYARALMRQNEFIWGKKKGYACRDKDEIQLWISTLPTIEERALWALFAEGLRRHDVLPRPDPYTGKPAGLRWSKFAEGRKCLKNVQRKRLRNQRSNHPWIRLSDSTVDLLKHHQAEANPTSPESFIFSFGGTKLTKNSRIHFKRLQDFLETQEMIAHSEISPCILTCLRKLIERGYPTPHELRHSWETHATERKMQVEYRRYHLNHCQQGGDAIYLHIDERPEAYFAEYDRAAPKYQYGFSMAMQVYPEIRKRNF
jgi:integrase